MTGENKARLTFIMVTACCLVFLAAQFRPFWYTQQILNEYALTPVVVMNGLNLFSLISYMFIHLSFGHLLGNMFVLISVGTILEENIGSTKFGLVYIVSGIASGLLHSSVNPSSTIPVIGASGAIFGLIALLLLLMPFHLTTALLFPLPGVIVGLIMIAVEITSVTVGADVGIAHDIHIYGFLVGGIGAFAVDYGRALRGLIIALIILVALYFSSTILNEYPIFQLQYYLR
jgi:membrane associated rhomboid family serine protease